MKSKYILLDKNILNKIEADKYLLYTIISKYKTVRDEIVFTLDYILQNLNINNNNSYARRKIIEILLLWQEMGIYKYNIGLNRIKNSDLIIADQCYDSSDNFVMIYDNELNKILKCKENVDINKLFAVFVYIKSCMDNITTICYPNFEKIKQSTLISHNKTISQYINILKNLKLIIVDNPGYKVFKNGNIRRSNNWYALPGHEHDLHDAIEKEKQKLEKKKIEIAKGVESNRKRSEAMKKYWREKKKNTNSIFQSST